MPFLRLNNLWAFNRPKLSANPSYKSCEKKDGGSFERRLTMPGILSPEIQYSFEPSGIPDHVMAALRSVERDANVILPTLLKYRNGANREVYTSVRQLWMWSTHSDQTEFVLSCTEGSLGSYPIFIVPTHNTPNPRMTQSMSLLVNVLVTLIPTSRVFSVFARKDIAQSFARKWSERTKIPRVLEPYYHAKISYCTSVVLRDLAISEDGHLDLKIEIRLADISDLTAVARLCQGFADSNDPFFLSDFGSVQEALHLIYHRQVWVLWVHRADGSFLASIAAHTRVSDSIATITKVYTDPSLRGKHYAERLTRRVCQELLKTKKEVALYVGIRNPAAVVYDRVGFVGLRPDSPLTQGVDEWMEVGFDREHVDLGHW